MNGSRIVEPNEPPSCDPEPHSDPYVFDEVFDPTVPDNPAPMSAEDAAADAEAEANGLQALDWTVRTRAILDGTGRLAPTPGMKRE
jgi:hypothetical protein